MSRMSWNWPSKALKMAYKRFFLFWVTKAQNKGKWGPKSYMHQRWRLLGKFWKGQWHGEVKSAEHQLTSTRFKCNFATSTWILPYRESFWGNFLRPILWWGHISWCRSQFSWQAQDLCVTLQPINRFYHGRCHFGVVLQGQSNGEVTMHISWQFS